MQSYFESSSLYSNPLSLSTLISLWERPVWLYDGNVDYLKGKHIPLFIASLLLSLISIPYTLLIFIQQLQHWSSYRVLFWVKKLKPLFDAYTGPYKDRHHYWTGLLLLLCIVLFLVLNTRGSADINLLAITVTVLSLFMHGVLFGTIYRHGLWMSLNTPFSSTLVSWHLSHCTWQMFSKVN